MLLVALPLTILMCAFPPPQVWEVEWAEIATAHPHIDACWGVERAEVATLHA